MHLYVYFKYYNIHTRVQVIDLPSSNLSNKYNHLIRQSTLVPYHIHPITTYNTIGKRNDPFYNKVVDKALCALTRFLDSGSQELKQNIIYPFSTVTEIAG